jgi:hypothetical protein
MQYVTVPDIWANYDIEGVTISPLGYATYHLTVYPPDTDLALGLYIEGQGSAYRLWVNDQLLAWNGQVGRDQQTMIPEKRPMTVFFRSDRESIELVLQISNFYHRKAGFRNNLILGLAQSVHQHQLQSWFEDAIPVGILLVMGFYHLFIYAFRSSDRAPLYFGLLCLAMASRIGVTNQYIALYHWLNLAR